jgi:hypothetical protein
MYRIAIPGGSWDLVDNGTYTIALQPNQVMDGSGNVALAANIGVFQVLIVGVDGAGNDFASARSLGVLSDGAVRIVEDFVGASDRNDYIKFTVQGPVSVDMRLLNLTNNADLQLLDSAGTRLAYSKNLGAASESFVITLQPGTYYARILYPGQGGTYYRLRVAVTAFTQPPPSDNTMDTARDLGLIRSGTVRTVDDFIGTSDRNDYYKITLDSPTRVYTKLYNLTDNADLQILDSAGNRIGYSKRGGAATEFLTLNLGAGTYYVRVLFAGVSSTSYRLRVEGL